MKRKVKKNGFSYKENLFITKDQCERLIKGDFEVLKEGDNPLCLDLYTKMHYQQLRPKNIVDYWREAYVYQAGNVRITLDYDIRASFNIQDFLMANPIFVPVTDTYILEVKYDNFLPEIIRGIVSLSSRRSAAFSKYAVARII